VSLDLVDRRIAMLAEMGLQVFLPPAAGPGDLEDAPDLIAARAQPERLAARFDAQTPVQVPARPTAVAPVPIARMPAPATAADAVQGRRPVGIETMEWDALADAVAGCQGCKLCGHRRNAVFGVGDRQADWLVVGEAPGENEDLQGEPFVGQAGKLLDNMLRALGLGRHEKVYIANVLKCRPPGNRNPEPDEVAQCEPFLRRQVELLQPKIILAMGRFAVQSLLNTQDPIGKLRGRVHEYNGVPVVVTYHPAYLLRNLPDKAKAWADLCLAQSLVQG
jgi:uracil-DNA glycosylase